MSTRPWMPLYVADYLVDTRDLTAEQHGIYVLLLMLAWRRDGQFPDDEMWLRANLPPMHGHTFNHVVRGILARFFTLENGQYSNKRLSKEIQKAFKLSSNQSQKAIKRWSDSRKNKDLADAAAMPSHSHSHSHSHKKDIDSAELRSDSPKEPKRNSRKAKTIPLPEGWCPPSRAITLANSLNVDLTETEARFRDYLASTGKQYVDYDAAFCNFIRNQPKFNGFKNNVSTGQRQLQDDRLSVSKAIDGMQEQVRAGTIEFAPRPRLVPVEGEGNIRLLSKR